MVAQVRYYTMALATLNAGRDISVATACKIIQVTFVMKMVEGLAVNGQKNYKNGGKNVAHQEAEHQCDGLNK